MRSRLQAGHRVRAPWSRQSRRRLLQHVSEAVVEARKLLVVVQHGLAQQARMLGRHERLDRRVADGRVLRLPLSVDLEERPLNVVLDVLAMQLAEGVQHPGLLVVREVLNREVVAQRVGPLLHDIGGGGAPGGEHVGEHGVEGGDGARGRGLLRHHGLQGLPHQGRVELGKQLAVRAALLLAVVHAVLASQGLDEVLQRRVAARVVGGADAALDLEQHRGEQRVEGLQVVRQLAQHRAQLGLPGGLIQARQQRVEAPQRIHGRAVVQLSLQCAHGVAADKLRQCCPGAGIGLLGVDGHPAAFDSGGVRSHWRQRRPRDYSLAVVAGRGAGSWNPPRRSGAGGRQAGHGGERRHGSEGGHRGRGGAGKAVWLDGFDLWAENSVLARQKQAGVSD
mmetsp:Transcript_3255/g.8248  ORF Transcript_3255/g.8248 Transcript_3255/m.8248 type:complete len:393 (-) Transcript_3255:18-1196(-)